LALQGLASRPPSNLSQAGSQPPAPPAGFHRKKNSSAYERFIGKTFRNPGDIFDENVNSSLDIFAFYTRYFHVLAAIAESSNPLTR
jgi:hypothetical protein